MSIAAACGWSLLRSLCIATVGVAVSAWLQRSLHRGSSRSVRVLWGLVLLPVFVPGLLIGYGYRNFSLSLVHQPLWNELVYAGLILLMAVPVGSLILLASPPAPLSAAGLHAARLIRGTRPAPARLSWFVFAAMWVRSRLFALLPAWSAMFLLSFQETEIATLMQTAGWPEWTFTRLATGMELSATAASLALPVLLQLIVIGAAGLLLSGPSRWTSVEHRAEELPGDKRGLCWGYALVALGLLLVVPGWFVIRGTWEGVAVLAAHPRLMQQIGVGLLFGASAGLLAWLLAGVLLQSLRGGLPLLLVVPLLVPGLLGAWTLGLLLAVLFSQPALRPVYDTPLPMILGEVLFQLPRAVLLRLLLGRWRESSSAHLARLLGWADDALRQRRSASLLWRLDLRARFTGGLIVCYWAYMELSIPSPALLGPPGMTTAPVLLYNQMHYGQIPGLSALVLATLAVPVVCLLAMSVGARFVALRRSS